MPSEWKDLSSNEKHARLLELALDRTREILSLPLPDPVNAECKRLERLFDEEWDRRGLSIDDNFVAWGQLREEMGFEAALEAEERAFNLIEAVTTKIRETTAKTFAGLAVKARALRFDAHLHTQCDLPSEDQDWPEYVMNQFVAEIERLAAAEL
jgi:hypothetical protein